MIVRAGRDLSAVSKPAKASRDDLALDAYLPFRLSLASDAVTRLIARAYEDRFGLSIPQWRLMAVLAARPCSPDDLLPQTGIDKATIGEAAGSLVARGLVARAAEPALLSLTPDGVRLHAEIAPLALAYEAALLAGLSPEEVRTLTRLLMRLEAAATQLCGRATR